MVTAASQGPAGVESVWDYPRPPRVERTARRLAIDFAGTRIVETGDAWRVLETSHPPTYYIPMSAFAPGVLVPTAGSSLCEWKGRAAYFDILVGDRRAARAAWHYPKPTALGQPLIDHVCVYASKVDACWVDGEKVQAQDGDFYGGWITSHVAGPFKGAPGTLGW